MKLPSFILFFSFRGLLRIMNFTDIYMIIMQNKYCHFLDLLSDIMFL